MKIQKKEFLQEIDEAIYRIQESEDIVNEGDVIGHEIKDRIDYDTVQMGHRFGETNEAGKRVHEFASVYELTIVNT